MTTLATPRNAFTALEQAQLAVRNAGLAIRPLDDSASAYCRIAAECLGYAQSALEFSGRSHLYDAEAISEEAA